MKPEDFNPKVSIVIPVYNGSKFLREAIESALKQTYKNVEVLVIDDGSTDSGATEKIAATYGDRIRYYKKVNGGVATALNFGIKKMTGDYFSWLSHDDMYKKTKIEDQVNHLNKLQEDVIVACNAKVLFPSGIKKKTNINADTFGFIDIFLATSAMVGVNGCSLLIPKSAFDVCGSFNANLPVTQDYDLWFRMKDKYKFVLLEKHLVISRRHDEQDSVLKQKLLFESGDQLHYNFLNTISYNRFEEYFKHSKKNLEHTYENYSVYKMRGYKKTASMILSNILRYYYENNKNNFYRVFNSEIESINKPKLVGERNGNKLTSADRKRIDMEYSTLINSGANNFPIKEHISVHETKQPETRTRYSANRLIKSIKRDGVYLTGEKIARKVYKKSTKRRS